MENLITRNTKFASIEEVVQLVENHKMAGAIVIGIGAMAYVLDKNLKDFLHDLNNTIAENGCVLDSKLVKFAIPPKSTCSNL